MGRGNWSIPSIVGPLACSGCRESVEETEEVQDQSVTSSLGFRLVSKRETDCVPSCRDPTYSQYEIMNGLLV